MIKNLEPSGEENMAEAEEAVALTFADTIPNPVRSGPSPRPRPTQAAEKSHEHTGEAVFQPYRSTRLVT